MTRVGHSRPEGFEYLASINWLSEGDDRFGERSEGGSGDFVAAELCEQFLLSREIQVFVLQNLLLQRDTRRLAGSYQKR